MADNYVTYHLHTDLSLLDSCTKFKDYVDYAVQLGQKAIAFTEHGNILNWIHKKMYCDKVGIKYLHGVECYLTENPHEKVRDNYHTILIAKNYDGVLELNSLVSRSNSADHFYYKPRITFDEFTRISPNIVKISACLASPLNKLSLDNGWYDKLARAYDYYEIQPHNCQDQILYNQHLAQLAQRFHKPLIAGTDTHSLNKYKAECRSILQKAKHIAYADEDAFDLTYKTYDELWEAFRQQGALPDSLIAEAINNTNVMADSVEEFTLDTAFKYPVLYGSHQRDAEEYDRQVQHFFEQKVQSGIIPAEQVQAFRDAIEEESRVFEKVDMKGYMLFVGELVRWCKSNGIPLGPSRGSVGGSRVAYILDITDLNPEQWHTVFSRFCNEDRKELGDVDLDLPPDSRDKVYQHIFDQFGTDYTAYILAIGTISSKGTIDEIGRALSQRWLEEHPNPDTNKYPYSLSECERIKKEFEADEEKTRQKYPEMFYYYDGLLDTAISQSMHPAGVVVSPVTLPDGYGVLNRDGKIVLQIDMEAIHEVNLVKYDLLGLANVQILRDTYQLLGKPYPRTCEIDWDDKAVWKDMLRSPVGIFQMESAFAFQSLRQFKPTSIFEMSLVTAAIRPSGASYRSDLLARKKHKNPSAIIDELLKENNSYLVYQEDTIKFLQQICGLSGSESDNVRRAIGRKDEERLQAALPQILEGYCNKSPKPRAEAEVEAKEFLQIIEDSASYQFGYNHSIGYCLIGYMCAYLRYYYPYEFITAYLNNAKTEEDTVNGSALAQEYGINITPPKFGVSKDVYVPDKERHIIAKGITSIKYMNKQITNELYNLKRADTFTDLLYAIENETSVDSRQLDILIRIEFFSDYGNPATLLKVNEAFKEFKAGTAKSFRKDKATAYADLLPQFARDTNAKGEQLKSWTITDCMGLIRACEQRIRNEALPDMTLQERAQTQLELLGCVNLTTGKEADRRKIFITDVIPLRSKEKGSVWAYKVGIKSIGSGKNAMVTVRDKVFRSTPFKRGDILYANSLVKDNRDYWYLQDYQIIC